MPIMWSNCRLYCQMNFWKANCMTSLIRCLIHSQAFKLMELYWFVCCYSKSTSLSLSHPPPPSPCLPPLSSFLFPLLRLTLRTTFCLSYPPFLPSFPLPQRLDVLTSIYSMSPPDGGVWDSISAATDMLTCVRMPDGLTVQVPVRRDQTAADLLSAACKVGLVASCRGNDDTTAVIAYSWQLLLK